MKIGCDIEENSRFEGKTLENDEKFLKRIFSEAELSYCFSKKNYHENFWIIKLLYIILKKI